MTAAPARYPAQDAGAFAAPPTRFLKRVRTSVRLSTILCWLAIITAFALSHLMLEYLGFHYDTPGGSPLQKIAPPTYLACLAIVALMLERNPEAVLNDVVRHHKGTILLAAAWSIQFAYILMFRSGALTNTIDTFIFPMALLIVLAQQTEAMKRHVAVFVHIFMAANALLGIAEFAGGFRLTPIFAEGIELIEWRSSAFLGHPLMNAVVTGAYVVILMLGGGRDMPKVLRAPALGLQAFALLVFGGRVASTLCAVYALVIGLGLAIRVLKGRKFPMIAAAIGAFLVPLLVMGFAALLADGFLDKFIDRYLNDGGSANSRLVMFDVLGNFSFEQLLVGPDPGHLATLQRVYGIAFGIESFWFAFIAFYGLLTSIPLFIGLFAFLADLVSKAQMKAWWVVLYFILVCSTSLSLAGKGTVMGLLVAMIVPLLRPRAESEAGETARRPQALRPSVRNSFRTARI